MTRPSIFEFAGGPEAFQKLAAAHHRRCLDDPVLNHPFSRTADHAGHIARLAAYWAEVFGGPPRYSQRHGGHAPVLAMHAGTEMDADVGERFAGCFLRAVDDAGLPDDPRLRSALRSYIAWATAEVLAHSHRHAPVPAGPPVPRWGWDGLVGDRPPAAVVPAPAAVVPAAGGFELTPAVGVHAPDAPEVADLLRELLRPATGLPLPPAPAPGPGVVALLVDRAATDLGPEGYRLVVTDDRVTATATGPAGLRWAVQTLRQLLPAEVYAARPAPGVRWAVGGVHLVDVPRHGWRGLMLDVARWYQPVAWLATVVDLLAAHRMNVLHLHLTDDQGWRFEVLGHPRLTSVGGHRAASPAGHETEQRSDDTPHGGHYTQRELRDLVAYAARRGVTVMPEIDIPGHAQAALAAYPQLGNDPGRPVPVWTRFGISTRVLNVADASVAFLREVLDELVEIFPSRFVHLGGDEVRTEEWLASAEARDRMARLGITDPLDLSGWWIRQLADHLAGHGREVVVWDDLLGHGAPPDAVVMAWQGTERVAAALRAGHRVVATPHTAMYLNYPEAIGPDEPLSFASGYPEVEPLPFEAVYRYDPHPRGDAAGLLGVQGNLWTEYAPTPARAEHFLLPRLAAVAEVAWGGPRDEAGLRARMAAHLRRLDAMGVGMRRGSFGP